jgi:lysophospholipase L1-like esterase
MSLSWRVVAGAVAALLVLALLVLLAVSAWRVAQAAALARESEPLQHRPDDVRLRLLVVGDSTAVGTGASSAAHSLAGLLAAAYPHLAIDNRARDGATFADVIGQLAGPGRYDLVLVQAGGNDVIRLRDLDQVRADVDRVAALARERSDAVLLMPAGNVGNARFFWPPLSWWMTARARRLHAIVQEVAVRRGAVYVDLYEDAADDPFVTRPGLYARDGLHPSDAGYRVWWRELSGQADLPARLAAARGG